MKWTDEKATQLQQADNCLTRIAKLEEAARHYKNNDAPNKYEKARKLKSLYDSYYESLLLQLQ